MRENSETLYGLSFNLTKKKTKASSVLMHTASQEPQAICLEGNSHYLSELSEIVSVKHPPHRRTKHSTINTRTALNQWLIRMITRKCCFYERFVKKCLTVRTLYNRQDEHQATEDQRLPFWTSHAGSDWTCRFPHVWVEITVVTTIQESHSER